MAPPIGQGATFLANPVQEQRMTTLFFIVFLDLVGFGMVIPVLPFFAEHLGVPPSWIIFLFGLYSLGQLLGAPLWGALSDRVGRRPVLLGTLLGNAAAYMILATAASAWQLGTARLLAGLAAGNIATAYAYIADRTEEGARARALGLLGAAFGLGFIVGPAIGGFLAGSGADSGSLARVAHAAAAMSGLAFLMTLAFLPESHGREQRAQARTLLRPNRWTLIARPVLRELLAATLLVVGGVAMFQSTFTMWSAAELGIRPRQLGSILGAMGILSVAVQGVAIGPLTKRYGPRLLGQAGATSAALCMAVLPFTHSVAEAALPLALFALGGGLFVPSISNLITATAGATERGAVLGVFQSASSLGRVVGPFAASAIASLAGLRWPFAAGALVSLGGALLVRPVSQGSPGSGSRTSEALAGTPVDASSSLA
jgi:DHA1 family tetracycline resistance protein-like MFS transporter